MRPGDRFGRYRIERVLGEGGMATVYLAEHDTLGSHHALKVLRVDVPEIKRRLMAEGRVQSSIRHPNVVSVTDIVEGESGVALVMEYVDGPALDEYQDERPLPIDEALELFRGIVLGVGEAHGQGVVHRDLKAANILLHRTSNAGVIPKVTDFGLVKLFDGGGTRSGVSMGTPEYMSPEQVRDSAAVDLRSDLWSLGVLLYEMLTGTVPFDGTDLLEIYNAIARAAYEPASTLRSDLPPHLDELIAALLVVDPGKRLQDCAAILAWLDRLPGAAATPGTSPPTNDRPAALRAAPLTLLGGGIGLSITAVLGAVCLGAVGFVLWPEEPAPEARPVVLQVDGVGPEVEWAVSFEGATFVGRDTIDLGTRAFGTEVEIGWAVGDRCRSCATGDCPSWCATGTRSWTVEAGGLPLILPLTLRPPEPQRVVVEASTPPSRAFFDGEGVPVDGARLVVDGVDQGQHLVVVEAGECPDEARGCGDDCPPGCTSVSRVVIVGAYEGVSLTVGLEPVPPAAPDPAPVPEPPPVVPTPTQGGGWVSSAAYARFLERNPEWRRDVAIAAKRVDSGYLRDWADGRPAGPVTRVTWAAAKAYCTDRGGLVPLEASPTSWDSSTVRQEWRDAGGRPGWRRRDGETSTVAVANRSFPYTGFRCRR